MRISDWSSDVCSSDRRLGASGTGRAVGGDLTTKCEQAAELGRHRAAHHLFDHHRTQTPDAALVDHRNQANANGLHEIGRSQRRARVCQYVYFWVVAVSIQKTHIKITIR